MLFGFHAPLHVFFDSLQKTDDRIVTDKVKHALTTQNYAITESAHR